jgi:hypothetical protein
MISWSYTREGWLGLPWRSHWFQSVLDIEVDNTREGSWSWSYHALCCPIATVGGGTFSGDVWALGLDIQWSVHRSGTYGPVSSCQAFNVFTSRGPDSDSAYPVSKAGSSCREPGCPDPGFIVGL